MGKWSSFQQKRLGSNRTGVKKMTTFWELLISKYDEMPTFLHCLLLTPKFLHTRIPIHFVHDHIVFSPSVRLLCCSHAVCQCHTTREGTLFFGKNLHFRGKITEIFSDILELHVTHGHYLTWAEVTNINNNNNNNNNMYFFYSAIPTGSLLMALYKLKN